MSRRKEWLAVTLILLVAAAFRFWMLGEVPPGLAQDEVANWLIARDILAGRHAVYFSAAYGHEPVYQYLQAGTVALLGDHWLGLRYPSAALGLLGRAATYVLVRRLFGRRTALLGAALLAVSFWPLFYARVALRAISLPLTAAVFAYFVARGMGAGRTGDAPCPAPSFMDWLLAGVFLGLSLYTYMAARVLPLIAAAILSYVVLVRREARKLWPYMVLMFVVATLVFLPLGGWLLKHPGAESRIAEVREPFDRLLVGDPALVLENLGKNLKMFTLSGDPWPRQNLPGRPVFADPLTAVLFYAGVGIALLRWRDPRHGFLLIWLAAALGPSVATSVAPSSIRDILAIVVTFFFPALSIAEIHHWLRVHCPRATAPKSLLFHTRWLLVVLPIALTGCLTIRDYFIRWPQHGVVRFDYQADLTAAARWLDELPDEADVAVAGLSVHTLDGPSIALAARRGIDGVRLCDTRETLVVPSGHLSWILVPRVVPFDSELEQRLSYWATEEERDASYTAYRISKDTLPCEQLPVINVLASWPDGSPVALPVSFAGLLSYLGHERLQQVVRAGGRVTLLTYWCVEEPAAAPLKAFVHLAGESDRPIAQYDGLASPPDGWHAGDLIVQKHTIDLPADLNPGQYSLLVGVYYAETNDRLDAPAADSLVLGALRVSE